MGNVSRLSLGRKADCQGAPTGAASMQNRRAWSARNGGNQNGSLTGRYVLLSSCKTDTQIHESRLSRITVALNGGAAAYEEAEKGRSGQRNLMALVRADIETYKNVERGQTHADLVVRVG